ncbi:MAG TPA: hypothetical protein P5274_01660 [Candidatus Paceibacterota bacterium]|nr:hypothetical protein [Candidatus Paceibacterota bacterium]
MLSLWPELYNFAYLGPLGLRLALGLIFLRQAILILWRPNLLGLPLARLIGLFEIVLGALVIISLWLQPVLILVLLELIGYFFLRKLIGSKLAWSYTEIFLLMVITLSLLVLGPGLLAFDLPL